MTDERPWVVACSIGSLNFMNCRSRAEAFARRLHTKLRSLGRSTDDNDDINEDITGQAANGLHGEEGAADEHTYTETSHLISAPLTQQQQQQQPPPLSFRDEEELFYDFDLESPGTPASEEDPVFLVNSCDNLCFDAHPLKAMGPACTRQPRSTTIHDAAGCPYSDAYCQAADPKSVTYGGASQRNEHWNEHGINNGTAECRVNEVSANGGHGPGMVIDSPVEESQESAYCSGGEQDGRVLDQGQSNETFSDAVAPGGGLLALNTALALAEEESDEDDDDELFSECQESVDDEVDGEWRQQKSTEAEEEVAENAPREEETGDETPLSSSTDQAISFDISKNEAVAANDENIMSETTEENTSVVDENDRENKKEQNNYDQTETTADENELSQSQHVNEESEADSEKVQDEIKNVEDIEVELIEEKEDEIFIIEGLKNSEKVNENDDAESEKHPIDEHKNESVEKEEEEEAKDEVDGEKNGKAEEKVEEEKKKEEEEEEEEDEEEEFLHSPTWGTLKQIDRFQVRKLVQESHEVPLVSSLFDFADNKDSNNQDEENQEEGEEEDDGNKEPLAADEIDDGAEKSVEILRSETSKISITIKLPEEGEFVHPRPPTPPIKKEELTDRPRIYRSSSLRSGKTPPGTPSSKKIVRFADVLGLDLEDVRHVFLDDLPTVPQSAYSDLDADVVLDDDDDSAECESTSSSAPRARARPPSRNLIAMFTQPGSSADFMQRVVAQKVCLDNAIYTESAIRGVVRVMNLAFHKSVFVRYTLNEWKTHFDLQANYLPNSSDGVTDRFSFCIYGGDTLDVGERLIFCLHYHIDDQEYWDSNNGQNYFFQCIMESHPLPPSPVDDWIHFL